MAFLPPLVLNSPSAAPSSRCRATPPPQCTATTEDSSDPLQTGIARLQALSNATFDTIFAPLLSSCSVVQRQWQTTGGNYILPCSTPKAVIHFLGGAFFGAAPHILYRTLLERLCSRGYLIVATPYDIQFDHLELTAGITERWEKVESDLALSYGALPVIGLGHSAGGVFHTIGNSLFEEAMPKVANILISFNNRQAVNAIPMYAQTVRPTADFIVNGVDALPTEFRKALVEFPETVDAVVQGNLFTPDKVKNNILPSVKESRRLVEQIWPLLKQVSESDQTVREFYPTPNDVQKSIQTLYNVDETLLVSFRGDNLDDSDQLLHSLQRGGKGVSLIQLEGTHLTPLAQELPNVAPGWASGVIQESLNAWGLRQLTALEVLIDEWIEKGIREHRF